MRRSALFVLVLGAALGSASGFAAPPPQGGGGGGGGGRPGYGGGGSAAHGPAYGHGGGYGGGYGYGHGGWYGGRYGYPYYGYGLALGLGYGTGWALGYPGYGYYWGAPYSYYPYYPYYPYGYVLPTAPAYTINEELVYVQPPQNEAPNPPAQQPSAGYWYYCTAPAGYHPYVTQCTRPWLAVDPQTGTQVR